MKEILRLFLFVFFVPLSSQSMAQDCVNPDGDIGVLLYNDDYGVLQVCTEQNWIGLNSMVCPEGDGSDPCGCGSIPPLGTECNDGSFYIGLSPEDGERVYMTDASFETSRRFDSDSCYRFGDGSVSTSQTDGRANTNALLAFNATGFYAAAYCDGLEAHGYDDWYLPAGGSGTGTEQNLFWAMVQAEGTVDGIGSTNSSYWSSTEDSSVSAWYQRFGIGSQYSTEKYTGYFVWCVRR